MDASSLRSHSNVCELTLRNRRNLTVVASISADPHVLGVQLVGVVVDSTREIIEMEGATMMVVASVRDAMTSIDEVEEEVAVVDSMVSKYYAMCLHQKHTEIL